MGKPLTYPQAVGRDESLCDSEWVWPVFESFFPSSFSTSHVLVSLWCSRIPSVAFSSTSRGSYIWWANAEQSRNDQISEVGSHSIAGRHLHPPIVNHTSPASLPRRDWTPSRVWHLHRSVDGPERIQKHSSQKTEEERRITQSKSTSRSRHPGQVLRIWAFSHSSLMAPNGWQKHSAHKLQPSVDQCIPSLTMWPLARRVTPSPWSSPTRACSSGTAANATRVRTGSSSNVAFANWRRADRVRIKHDV